MYRKLIYDNFLLIKFELSRLLQLQLFNLLYQKCIQAIFYQLNFSLASPLDRYHKELEFQIGFQNPKKRIFMIKIDLVRRKKNKMFKRILIHKKFIISQFWLIIRGLRYQQCLRSKWQ